MGGHERIGSGRSLGEKNEETMPESGRTIFVAAERRSQEIDDDRRHCKAPFHGEHCKSLVTNGGGR